MIEYNHLEDFILDKIGSIIHYDKGLFVLDESISHSDVGVCIQSGVWSGFINDYDYQLTSNHYGVILGTFIGKNIITLFVFSEIEKVFKYVDLNI